MPSRKLVKGSATGRFRATVAALAVLACIPGQATIAQTANGKFSINIASVLLAEPGVETPLPIQIAPADNLPKNSFIRIRGLPASATLSEGHVVAPGSWAVPLSALPTLKVAAPITESGRADLTVALVGIDGTIWAEARSTLAVMSAAALPVDGQAGSPAQTTVATIGPAGAPPPDANAQASDVAPVPPRPRPAALSPEDNERALGWVEKGDELMEQGDVAGARLFYERAASIGLGKAAIALAETYDPHELSRWPVRGLRPDLEQARHWYERALELGAPEADARLQRLSAR
jgi:hypothetical protein